MKKNTFLMILSILIASITISTHANPAAGSLENTNSTSNSLVWSDFEIMRIVFPEDCFIDDKISEDVGGACLRNENNDFVMILFLFNIDDDFDTRNRLISEAAEMDIDATDNLMAITMGEGKEPIWFTCATGDGQETCIGCYADYAKEMAMCVMILSQGNNEINPMVLLSKFRPI